ncbi:hypothetical protein ASF22_04925 [Methylobacterium sp. Leaf87]|uniref:glycosyltransferase family protein n=1 Tax=Methylobacterium sp. Leaf87 TaxID=1736243 RepID=UPI0006F513D3|nr:glycosyltransferase [Methylobacterium sp. Leaf87]KQO66014.1 hypothetical protein ASF22_04925 [Methylobacterium sp. Leaf87]
MADFSILLLDTEPGTHNHYIVLAIADALRRHPRVARVHLAGHADALATLTDEGLDTVLAFGGARKHAPVLGRLAARAQLSILWTTEDPYELADNVRCSTGFDLVFTNDKASVAAYGGRARHLPLAAASLFQDLPVLGDDRDYLYDLLFIGTAWPNRVASLNAILATLSRDLKVKLALPWNTYIGPPALDDPGLVTDWRCGNRDFARLANRSRVVLTLPRVFSASDPNQAQGSTPPPRLFETALAGGFQVVISPEPEICDYYEPDAEIALCADDAAGARIIAEMLDRPAARIAAARAARARTLAEHLYDHRVAEILETAGGPHRRARPAKRPAARTVLMVSHNRTGYRDGGGVEIYQDALAGLAPDYAILFLFPVLHDGRWSLRLEGRGLGQTIECGEIGLPKLTDPHVEGVFERILFEQRVDLVHIHHLLHLPLSLPLVARACGVPVVYHLHDHHLICERWLLLDHAGRFCDVVNRGRDQCDACLIASSNYPPGAKVRRDGFVSLLVRAVDRFITSTPATGAYLRAFYPEIEADRVVEIAMLAPVEPKPIVPMLRPERDDGPRLTVAVVGNFAAHKGGDEIVELMRICEEYRIHFKVFGRVEAHHAGRLRGIAPDRITLSGPYEPHAIHGLLSGCDVSLHLSTWPETYVIALMEAWQAGLVPVATALGALAERVTDGVDGFLVPPHDPGAVRARLLDLYYDPARLARMRNAVQAKRFPTVAAHLEAVRRVYDGLVAARPCPHDRVPDRLRVTFDLSLAEMGLRVNAPSWVSRDIHWDGTYAAALGATGRARPATPLLDDLPASDRALPAVVLPLTHATLAFARDGLRLDDREIANPGGHDLVLRHLAVKGWLHRLDAAPAARTYLRFTGPSRTAYAVLQPDDRPDVADSLGDPGAARSGFTGTIDVDGLAFGPHTLDLVQAGRDGLLVAQGFGQVFAGGATEGALVRFAREATPPGAVPGPALLDLRQNLPEAGGVLLAAPGDLWGIAGRIEGAASDLPLSLWLHGEDGTAWRARIAPGAAGDGTFRLVAALTGLEPGRYDIALHGGDGVHSGAVPRRLEIVAGPGCYRLDQTMPPAFRRHFIKRLKRAPAIERTERVNLTGLGGSIACRGWAFARGLGDVLCTLAVWNDAAGRPQVCVSARLARPEVAAHLGTAQALGSGFELAVPRAALQAGGVRVFQCYRRRTVEFTGFAAALQRAVG